MIRINLLPQRRKAVEAGGGGDLWLLAAMGLLLLEIVALFFFHASMEEKLADQEKKNQEISAQIKQSTQAVANHAQVKQELERMRAREEAIAKLQSARSGPTAVLLELARILTPGRGPTVNPEKLAQLPRDNPLAVFNPSWDPRRLWITRFIEETRLVRLEGTARNAEDVSELARRMNLSDYFHAVRLLPAKSAELEGLDVVNFSLEAEVRY